MTSKTTPITLMVPALRDNVAEHGQTRLEQLPEGYPTYDALTQNGRDAIPRKPLPFPSVVGASRNDPLARFERVECMAKDWGSRLVDLGEIGHLNPAAGFGAWPMA
jgi:hypothetical protein